MGAAWPLTDLRNYLNPQPVVLKVSETICLPLQDFHFGVEAFGDSVVAGEAPHGRDFLARSVQSIAECHQWVEPATTERSHIPEEAAREFATARLIPALLRQQVRQALLEAVNGFQRRPVAEIF
jgi:hypothetical protein